MVHWYILTRAHVYRYLFSYLFIYASKLKHFKWKTKQRRWVSHFVRAFCPKNNYIETVNCVANRPNLRQVREAVETGTVLLLWEASERPAFLHYEGDLCHWIQAHRQQCHHTFGYSWEQIVKLVSVLSSTLWNVTCFLIGGHQSFSKILWTWRQYFPSKLC